MKRFLILLACLGVLECTSVCLAAAPYQKIYLTSGETIEGRIDRGPDDSLAIQERSTRQVRNYPKADIVKIEYYNEQGNLFEEYNYAGGLKDGEHKIYNTDGSLYEEGSYAHGQRDGIARQYFENGKLRWEKTYDRGTLIHTTMCKEVLEREESILSVVGYECEDH